MFKPSTNGIPHKWLVLAAVAMGVFLATIDGSIVNIALPTLVNSLHVPFALVEWVVLAYLLTITTLMLSIGRLADMVGKKSLFLAGMIIFTTGSLLCGLSTTIGYLIASRVIQAVGAALTMALGTAIVTEAFPSEERGRALGLNGLMVSLGIIIGPTLGGLLLEHFSWNWLFFVNLPVGLAGIIMVIRYVRRFLMYRARLSSVCRITPSRPGTGSGRRKARPRISRPGPPRKSARPVPPTRRKPSGQARAPISPT